MFPYRVKYTESEYNIQNNDLLYKIDQSCQNTFDFFENVWENQKYIFSKKNDFKMISVLWRFVWAAFGGPKIIVYIYIYSWSWTEPEQSSERKLHANNPLGQQCSFSVWNFIGAQASWTHAPLPPHRAQAVVVRSRSLLACLLACLREVDFEDSAWNGARADGAGDTAK